MLLIPDRETACCEAKRVKFHSISQQLASLAWRHLARLTIENVIGGYCIDLHTSWRVPEDRRMVARRPEL